MADQRTRESGHSGEETFAFRVGDLVLVKWNDGMVYFAKIKKIDYKKSKCIVIFDDKSQDEAPFSQIHNVNETTTDIICIKCKKDDSDAPNEIVLCDTCGIGFHQRCHVPPIPASALELDTPWNCVYCQKGTKCPYLTESLDVLQNLLSDTESRDGDESVVTVESEEGGEDRSKTTPRKRKGRKVGSRHRRKVQKTHSPEKQPPKPSALSAEAWRHKLASTDRSYSSTPKADMESHSPANTPPERSSKKRKRAHAGGTVKKQKRSSVQSCTVSVTRLSMPICDESPTSTEHEQSHDSATLSDTESNPPPFGETMPPFEKPATTVEEKRPRSLRVSLSLPEEIESGSPLDKVVTASQKLPLSPKLKSPVIALPAWEEISTTAPKTSPPKQGVAMPTPQAHSPAHFPTISAPDRKRKHSEDEAATKAVTFPKKEVLTNSAPSPPVSPSSDDVFESPAVNSNTRSIPQTPVSILVTATQPQIIQPQTTPVTSKPSIATNQVAFVATNLPQVHQNATSTTTTTPMHLPFQTTKPAAVTNTVAHSSVRISATVQPATTSTTTVTPSPMQVTPSNRPNHFSAEPVPASNTGRGVHTTPMVHTVHGTMVQPMQAAQSSPYTVTVTPTQPPASVHRPTTLPAATPKSQPSMSAFTQEQPSRLTPMASSSITPTTVIHTAPKVPIAKPSVLQQTRHKASSVTPSPTPSPAVTHKQIGSMPPIQNLVSTAMNSALATTMASLNEGNQSEEKAPHPIPNQHPPKETISTAIATDVDDVIITGVEALPRKPSVLSHTQNVYRQAATSSVATSYPPPSHQERPQKLRALPDPRPVKRVTAKTVEIQPVTPRSGPQTPSATASTLHTQAAGAIVTPIASQTPVSVVQTMPVVLTPTAYTSAAQDAAPTYLIPTTPGTPGQGGKQVAYAVLSPQGTQQQPIQYVIKEGVPIYTPPESASSISSAHTAHYMPVPPSTSPVVYTQPISHASVSQAHRKTGILYYPPHVQTPTSITKNIPASTATTKPYAIVPAQPTPAEYRRAVAQQASGHTGPQLAAVGLVQGTQTVMATRQTGGEVGARGANVTYSIQKKAPPILPKPSVGSRPASHSFMVHTAPDNGNGHRSPQTEIMSGHLQAISKKIGAAFSQCNEEMLIAAFEDAWKKFQANGRRYDSLAHSSKASSITKTHIPPNAEVVAVPGTSSRVSLVRATAGRPKPIAPKAVPTTPVTHATMPVTHATMPVTQATSQNPQQQQYIYTYTTNTTQPQVIIQPISSDYAIYTVAPKQQKTYQVQTAGLFYPAQETSTKADAAPPQQIVIAQPVQQAPVPTVTQQVLTERAVPIRGSPVGVTMPTQPHPSRRHHDSAPSRRRSGSKSTRMCALCSKEATYLCSGCRSEWYCGRECQLKAWDEHSHYCKA